MVDDFAPNSIFLCGKGERGGRGRQEVRWRGEQEIKAAGTNKELDVTKEEGSVIGRGPSILTGPEEEEKGNDRHVGDGKGGDRSRGRVSYSKGVEEELDWDWLDAVRRRVQLGVGPELALEAKIDGTNGIFADVAGPQAGKRLANRAEGVFHRARSNGPAAGGQAAIPVTGSKDLQDGDWIGQRREVWIQGKGGRELGPPLPVKIGGGGTTRNDAGSDRCLDKAKVSAEFIGGRRLESSHETGCG